VILDSKRTEAPDIDIDLCQERRYEVIDYVRNKYGDANVAQIVMTFGTLKAKTVLEDLVPLQKLPNKDKAREVVTTQWEMGDIEKAGLLKMDFLGLYNLATLAAAVRIINARHPDAPLDLERLPWVLPIR
jgi:DNA polymerase-3 subunit alpha